MLGFLSKYSLLKPVIDTKKCNNCGLCARNCKASCINIKAHEIDYSRCVACMDCINKCRKGAITYTRRKPASAAVSQETSVAPEQVNDARRAFLSTTAVFAATAALKAQEKKVDGGLAVIEDKKIPERATPITPPGSLSARHCPAGAIQMVPSDPEDEASIKIPVVNAERCIGCGACENLCPSRPFSAIYVEGHVMHRTV